MGEEARILLKKKEGTILGDDFIFEKCCNYGMEIKLTSVPQMTFVGIRHSMSFVENQTAKLWAAFMPVRDQIEGTIGNELYSIENYPIGFFEPFNPKTEFEKWAAVRVAGETPIPDGMEQLPVEGGKYAVFTYRGLPSEAAPFFQQIFSQVLPQAGLQVDNRPHFAIMGEKYKGNHPDSEEEIWIPVVG